MRPETFHETLYMGLSLVVNRRTNRHFSRHNLHSTWSILKSTQLLIGLRLASTLQSDTLGAGILRSRAVGHQGLQKSRNASTDFAWHPLLRYRLGNRSILRPTDSQRQALSIKLLRIWLLRRAKRCPCRFMTMDMRLNDTRPPHRSHLLDPSRSLSLPLCAMLLQDELGKQ